MAKPAKKGSSKKKDELSAVSKQLSKNCVRSIREFQAHARKLDKLMKNHLDEAIDDPSKLKPGVVQSLMTSGGIAMDKQFAGQRMIQDLAMTSGDTVEATMIIIEEDPKTRARRVLGVPPELEGIVPLG